MYFFTLVYLFFRFWFGAITLLPCFLNSNNLILSYRRFSSNYVLYVFSFLFLLLSNFHPFPFFIPEKGGNSTCFLFLLFYFPRISTLFTFSTPIGVEIWLCFFFLLCYFSRISTLFLVYMLIRVEIWLCFFFLLCYFLGISTLFPVSTPIRVEIWLCFFFLLFYFPRISTLFPVSMPHKGGNLTYISFLALLLS